VELGNRRRSGVRLEGVGDRLEVPDQPVGRVEPLERFGAVPADVADDGREVVQLVRGGDERDIPAGAPELGDVVARDPR
jgi:hypothetical protein